jgi:ribosome recycling factor
LPCPTLLKTFSTSPPFLRKGNKAARKEAAAEQSSSAEVNDPFDFSSLEDGIKDVHTQLERALQKLRTGGRFNPEILEGVRVHLTKDSKKAIRLGELAQVLPKGGRTVMVLVGEADVSLPFRKYWR